MKCARAQCYRHPTAGRDDGLCYRHRSEAANAAKQKARRDARVKKPKTGRPRANEWAQCIRCARETRADKLRAKVCGRCRQRARTAARHAEQMAEAQAWHEARCSVSGCTRPRETERTCIEHAPRFDSVRQPRTLRAEDFVVRTRDPREGV